MCGTGYFDIEKVMALEGVSSFGLYGLMLSHILFVHFILYRSYHSIESLYEKDVIDRTEFSRLLVFYA